MVKRTASAKDEEPEQMAFERPSEKEHLFQVSDIFDKNNAPGNMVLDDLTVCAKLEVVGGEEEGRTMLNRMVLDDGWKGFFATRLFLKAIGEPYKGDNFDIDTDRWQACQFYATVVHDGKYANIKEYNFEKIVENVKPDTQVKDNRVNPDEPVSAEEVEWDAE